MDFQSWLNSLSSQDRDLVVQYRKAAHAEEIVNERLSSGGRAGIYSDSFTYMQSVANTAPALEHQMRARGLYDTFWTYGVKTAGLGQGAGLLAMLAIVTGGAGYLASTGGLGATTAANAAVSTGATSSVSAVAVPAGSVAASTTTAVVGTGGAVAGGAATATATEGILAGASSTLGAVGATVSAASTLGMLKPKEPAFTDYQGYSTGYDMANLPPEPAQQSKSGSVVLMAIAAIGIPFLLFA